MPRSCPFCAEEIQSAALICKHCGRQVKAGVVPPPVTSTQTVIVGSKSDGTAAILSLFIPGLGQMYKGNIAGGVLFLCLTLFGYLYYILLGLILHIAAVVHAGRSEPQSTNAAARGRPPECGGCGAVVAPSDAHCPNCGREIRSAINQNRETTANEIRCRQCGSIATRGPRACAACGSSYA
jgi:TM2 domain-containing membrane protein YozV